MNWRKFRGRFHSSFHSSLLRIHVCVSQSASHPRFSHIVRRLHFPSVMRPFMCLYALYDRPISFIEIIHYSKRALKQPITVNNSILLGANKQTSSLARIHCRPLALPRLTLQHTQILSFVLVIFGVLLRHSCTVSMCSSEVIVYSKFFSLFSHSLFLSFFPLILKSSTFKEMDLVLREHFLFQLVKSGYMLRAFCPHSKHHYFAFVFVFITLFSNFRDNFSFKFFVKFFSILFFFRNTILIQIKSTFNAFYLNAFFIDLMNNANDPRCNQKMHFG